MLNKIKENYGKAKIWVGEHKWQVLAGVGVLVAGAIGTAVVAGYKNEPEEAIDIDLELVNAEPKAIDYGRDVMMNFVVDEEGGETLGSVPCTEYFANQMIGDYEDYKETKTEE